MASTKENPKLQFGETPQGDGDRYPLVSIIVTTKNEEKNIENCLRSIKSQTYPQHRIEIILVDNFSTDRTKDIALQYTDKVYDKGPERSAQRNYGVEKAKGDYVLYLDADMILSEGVVLACVEKIRDNPDLVALYISEIVMGESYFSRVRRFERSFYDGTVIDCVRFIKKEAFMKVGGFDESLNGPEDWDLDKKIRMTGKTDLISAPIYHNESRFNLRQYLKKKEYYVSSFDAYIAKWPNDDTDIRKQFGLYYRLLGVFVENGKWKKLVSSPHLTAGLYLLRFLVGLTFVTRSKNKNVMKLRKY